jgi:hypothetical protein
LISEARDSGSLSVRPQHSVGIDTAVGVRVLVTKIHFIDAQVSIGMNGLRYVGATSVSRSGSRWLAQARTWYPEHSAWGVGGGKGRDGRVSQRTNGSGEGNVHDVKGVTGVWRGAVNGAAGPGRPGVWGSGAEVRLGVRGLGAGGIVRGWNRSSVDQIVQRYGRGGVTSVILSV